MRTEKEVLSALINWATADVNIRALLLAGSRANDRAIVDVLSDYDVEVVANDIDAFKDNAWPSRFGDIMATFSEDRTDGLTRLVLYKDGTRIDFQLFDSHQFNKKVRLSAVNNDWDIGVRVLMDKDTLAATMKAPTHARYNLNKPSRQEYESLIGDFWWDSTYVAKSLWRDELYHAKYMLDSVIRFGYLKTVIEWYIGMNNGWNVNTNKQGRWFKKYVDADLWRRIEATFAGPGVEENWDALFAMTSLFGTLALEIGKQLKFDYPRGLEQNVMNYLRTIKNLEHESTSGRT